MAGSTVLEPLIAAGVTAAIRYDGRIVVSPAERITDALDAHIRNHRDELIAALAAPRAAPLGWPPPEPVWFTEWMETDDARRAATMAAGKRRLDELSRKRCR